MNENETDKDTMFLLKECDAGAKMSLSPFNEVLDRVRNPEMKKLLSESKSHHEKLCEQIHSLLNDYGVEDKDPNPIVQKMSQVKTSIKLGMDDDDTVIARLITDGCDMGVKSLYKYMNQYKFANDASRDICQRLITIEEKLRDDLQPYL